jgi:hypothetical protein
MNYTNVYPAFEGPNHKDLHTRDTDCVCRPFYKRDDRGETELTHVKHQPLTEANKAFGKRPTWLPDEGDTEWSGGGKVVIVPSPKSRRWQ